MRQLVEVACTACEESNLEKGQNPRPAVCVCMYVRVCCAAVSPGTCTRGQEGQRRRSVSGEGQKQVWEGSELQGFGITVHQPKDGV
eukprot:3845719-Rhodomonas_salina.2